MSAMEADFVVNAVAIFKEYDSQDVAVDVVCNCSYARGSLSWLAVVSQACHPEGPSDGCTKLRSRVHKRQCSLGWEKVVVD